MVTSLPPILVLSTDNVNPWKNLALEEFLMGLCQSDSQPNDQRPYSAILFLWQNQHTVVIGRNQNAWVECACQRLEDEGGFLARRSTGGGAVYHDLGNLNFSIILPRSRFDLGQSFQVILDAVQSLGIEAVRSGRNDILVQDRKFSGNAFRYFKGVALHHGTLMVDTDIDPLLRYLTVSDSKLKSRAIKSVRSRVINLIEAKEDLTVRDLSQAVTASFIRHYGAGAPLESLDAGAFHDHPDLVQLEARYSSWDWRYGKSLDFDASLETGRHDWGQAQLLVKVEKGLITRALIYSDALDSDFIESLAHQLQGLRFNGEDMARALSGLGKASDTVGEISQKIIADDIASAIRDQSF